MAAVRGPRLSALLALSLLGAVTVAPSPSQAAEPGGQPSIGVLSEGAVRTGGAGGVVRVRVSCPAEVTAEDGVLLSVYAQVTQRTATGTLASSGGYRSLSRCGPEPSVALVPISRPVVDDDHDGDFTTYPSPPLRAGLAAVSASLSICLEDEDECSRASALGEQTLVQRDDLDRSRARGQGLRLRLPSSIRVLASGAAAVVRVPYVCSADHEDHGSANVTLRQAVPRDDTTVWLFRHERLVCDGTPHVLRVGLQGSRGHALRERAAWLVVHANCGYGCRGAEAWREVVPEAEG